MSELKLRRIDRSVHQLAYAAKAWRHQGWDAVLETPPRNGVWISLTDDEHRWQGWLRLQDWLENSVPELANLALSAGVDKQVIQWLAAVEQPLVLPIPELSYKRLLLGEPVSGDVLPLGPMLRVMGENGPLWLKQTPKVNVDDSNMLANLSWPIRFILGDSRISLSLIGLVRLGDVLLIKVPVSEIRCYSKIVGFYQEVEEGIVMEYKDLQNVVDHVEIASDMGQLPVQLEFIMHNCRLTLAELRNQKMQQLLPLPVDAERRIEIRANGARVGYGELVQLDGLLGVEVNEWFNESTYDK